MKKTVCYGLLALTLAWGMALACCDLTGSNSDKDGNGGGGDNNGGGDNGGGAEMRQGSQGKLR